MKESLPALQWSVIIKAVNKNELGKPRGVMLSSGVRASISSGTKSAVLLRRHSEQKLNWRARGGGSLSCRTQLENAGKMAWEEKAEGKKIPPNKKWLTGARTVRQSPDTLFWHGCSAVPAQFAGTAGRSRCESGRQAVVAVRQWHSLSRNVRPVLLFPTVLYLKTPNRLQNGALMKRQN